MADSVFGPATGPVPGSGPELTGPARPGGRRRPRRLRLRGGASDDARRPPHPTVWAVSTAPDPIGALSRRVAGPVLTPGSPGYDEERTGHNLLIDDRPAVVVGATGAADVMAAVAFATDHGLPVAVRCSGHTASLPADGAVLVTTRRMQGVRVDPYSAAVRVDAGVRWDRVIHESQAFGLAPLCGSSPAVGVVGYLLGGGLPLLGRAFGYAADHVRSIDVVTAHGMLRQATPHQYADLFWALRGGKGNFGVVTSVEFDLFPVPRVYGGGLFFAGSSAAAVLHAYRRWVRTVPDEMSSSVALNRFPSAAEVPDPLRGRFVVHVRIAYTGSVADGEALVRPLRRVAPPLLDTLADLTYGEIGSVHSDPTQPLVLHERAAFLGRLDEDAVDALLDLVGPDTSCPLEFVELRHLGGALAREPAVPNAVGSRDAAFLLYAASSDPTRRGADVVSDQTRLVIDGMAAWGTGQAFVNFLGADDVAVDDVAAGYPPQTYRRLAAVKRNFDPDNIFRINHNIPPAGSSRDR